MEKFKKLSRAEMKNVLGGDFPNPCKWHNCGDQSCLSDSRCACVYEANPPFYGNVCVTVPSV